jgi:hypothetical protein
MAFEVAFYSYFQETKIDDMDVRRGIHGNIIMDNFFYKEIHRWESEKDPRYDYCFLEIYKKLGRENNCHEFMGFSMIKAIQDLRERLGDNMVRFLINLIYVGKLAAWETLVHKV